MINYDQICYICDKLGENTSRLHNNEKTNIHNTPMKDTHLHVQEFLIKFWYYTISI